MPDTVYPLWNMHNCCWYRSYKSLSSASGLSQPLKSRMFPILLMHPVTCWLHNGLQLHRMGRCLNNRSPNQHCMFLFECLNSLKYSLNQTFDLLPAGLPQTMSHCLLSGFPLSTIPDCCHYFFQNRPLPDFYRPYHPC